MLRAVEDLPQTPGFRFVAHTHDGRKLNGRMIWCASKGRYVPCPQNMKGWTPR